MKLGVSGHSNYHTVHVLPNALHGLGPLGHVIHVHTDSTYLTERGLACRAETWWDTAGPGGGAMGERREGSFANYNYFDIWQSCDK